MNEAQDKESRPDSLDAVHDERSASIAGARASVMLEGFQLNAEVERINGRFVRGEITRSEHIVAIQAACGLAPSQGA